MENTQDFSKVLNDISGAFKVDAAAFETAFKSTATLNEKLSGVALSAAEQSAAVSSKWANDTLAKLSAVSAAGNEPADYAKMITDFASATAEAASEHLAAYGEIAKRAQMDTAELLMAAGNGFSKEATSAVKKATKKAA